MSLVSLSPTDYPDLAGLIRSLEPALKSTRTSLSLSSVRADSLSGELAGALKVAKKTSMTLAPEAGTERMRGVIGKPMSDEAILASAAKAFSLGFNRLKLYFIVGLPEETDEDVDAIADLSRAISREAKDGRIKLSVSGFVPKAHTQFEREAQNTIQQLSEKARRIKSRAKSRRIDVGWHDPRVSFLEATMSRGDRDLSEVILSAYRKGCRFDGWSELFDYEKWMSAFEESGSDPTDYSGSMRGKESLPWDFIGMGRPLPGRAAGSDAVVGEPISEGSPGRQTRRVSRRPLQRMGKYRVKYMKLKEARFTSHLDVMRTVVRTLRRAGLPLAYSQGFSARPRISFGPPLSVGMTSACEYFDFMTERPYAQDMLASIVNASPPGLKIVSVTPVFVKSRSLSEILNVAEYRVSNAKLTKGRLDEFLSKGSCEILQTRGDKERVIDVRPLLLDLKPENGTLRLKIHMKKSGWVGPTEILSAIEGKPSESFLDVEIERIGLYTLKSGVLLTPTAERVKDE
jgi:radical SAM-linked protein